MYSLAASLTCVMVGRLSHRSISLFLYIYTHKSILAVIHNGLILIFLNIKKYQVYKKYFNCFEATSK